MKVSILNVVTIIFTSVGFLPRALALGMGHRGPKSNLRSIKHQKQEGPVLRGNFPTAVSIEDKMMKGKLEEDKMLEDKLSSKSLSCHPRSPDGRMLA